MKKKSILILLLLSACVGGKSAHEIYTLRSNGVDAGGCKTGRSIEIAEPTTAPGLDSRYIAVMLGGQQLSHYNGVRWAGTVPQLFQEILVGAFENSGAFRNVSASEQAVSSDRVVLTDIRNFEVTDETAPTVKVKLVAKLLNSETRNVILSIPVEKEVTPQANKMEAIIEAFNSASNDAAAEIVRASAPCRR